MKAIILAGGRATRLGPLTAQLNKALVSVGQRPIIAHHLELLRNAGVTDTVVVLSSSSMQQVQDVVSRSHADMEMNVHFVEQPRADGPAAAVEIGARHLLSVIDEDDDQTYVLMADTFIDEGLPAIGDAWVGLGEAPVTRDWCYPREDVGYDEGHAAKGSLVCIGAYGFGSLKELRLAAEHACSEFADFPETPMAPLLEAYDSIDTHEVFNTWLDVGDVRALTAARRKRFITRDFNSLELTDQGVIIKRGDLEQLHPEMTYFDKLSNVAQTLFPKFLGPTARRDGYKIEYVDLPSLAELYLYWPGRPEMWAGVVEDLVVRLRRDLWGKPFYDEDIAVNWHNDMYSEKPWKRLKTWEEQGNEVDWILAERLGGFLASHKTTKLVCGHGDLNFGNVLCGLGSGVIKLVDPRGDLFVDLDYELAKLRYSYRDGFSAICHNLFELTDDGVIFGPNRVAEAEAIDRVLLDLSDLRRVTAVEASIFFSAAPLHNAKQGTALYRQGCKLAREALDDNLWSTDE